jgi:hypothetical protein
MVKFEDFNMANRPFISYDDLDRYAEALVKDFMPEALKTPQPMDIDAFLKVYLGLSVEYHMLGYDRPFLGLTAFNDEEILILDKKTEDPVVLPVKAGTIIIDDTLQLKRNIHRMRFTCAHEASHWLLHKGAYIKNNRIIDTGSPEIERLAAKEGRIDFSRCKKVKTEKERFERQADYLSASLLMVKPALGVAYRNYFIGRNEPPRRIALETQSDRELAVLVSRHISRTSNVSERAARIRLEKLSVIRA